MSTLVKPIEIGKLRLPNNVLYAPLAGCTDFPFRRIASRFRPGLLFCEMVSIDALLYADPATFRSLHYSHDMHPIGAQLCGSCPKRAGAAAKILEEMGFDVIDLNCGCPVDRVTKDGSGSALLKTPLLIGEILSSMVNAVNIPVMVKIRAGWDDLVFKDIVHIAQLAGANAITIHARTKKQGYRGRAQWDWIREAKEQALSIKVIGNGDIVCAEDAIKMLQETQCDGVMIGRGMLRQPWLADDIRIQGDGSLTVSQRRKLFMDHFQEVLAYSSDRRALVDMRRIGCWYVGRSEGAKPFREALSHASTLEEIESLIVQAPIGE